MNISLLFTSTLVHVLRRSSPLIANYGQTGQRKKSESIIWFCERRDWALCQGHPFKPAVSLPPRGLKWCFRDSDCFPHIRPSITADTPRQRTTGWRWFKFNCRKVLGGGIHKYRFSFKHMVNKNKNKSIHQRAACSQGQSGRLGWWLNWQGW